MIKMQYIKKAIRNIFNNLGLEIKKKEPWIKYGWMVDEGIKAILDIGANKGQFTLRIHNLLPNACIYAFEPLKICFDELKRTMRGEPKFSCFNFALGEENGRREIYHNDFTPSSSILPMEDLHRNAFPKALRVRKEVIEVHKLDDIADSLNLNTQILIKIDVQGYEANVIRGGEQTIKRAKILIVETSFERLYRGQKLFDDIYSMVKALGFELKGVEEPLHHPKDGRILQCDSIFVNKNISTYVSI